LYRVVLTGWTLVAALSVASQAAAQAALTFTLEEVTGIAREDAREEQESRPATDEKFGHMLGELRWGMSHAQVLALLKARVRADYESHIRRERDVVRQDALYQEMKARYQRIKDSVMEFDGRKTGWDVSPVAGEFRHGSRESLLYVDGEETRDLYFFIGGRLWKWYRELKPDPREGSRYPQTSELLKEQFGRAKPQEERRNDEGESFAGLVWQDPLTRLSVVQRGADTCLVFEARATIEQLAALRQHALPRGPKQNPVLDQVFMTAAEREAWREQQDREPRASSRAR
jgi:hypothetical protein